jgi:ribosomal protein S12 methylthiotransferase
MRRGIDKEGTISLINKIRDTIPGVAIRTSLIVGYPGETEKEFMELKEFVLESRFDRLGIFTYSHEEDTAAYLLKDKIPAGIKEKRAGELMEIQQEISLELNTMKSGKLFKVIIDRIDGDYFIGRTEFDSPEIDNEVLIPVSGNPLTIGDFYNIKITSADNFDLYGEFYPG